MDVFLQRAWMCFISLSVWVGMWKGWKSGIPCTQACLLMYTVSVWSNFCCVWLHQNCYFDNCGVASDENFDQNGHNLFPCSISQEIWTWAAIFCYYLVVSCHLILPTFFRVHWHRDTHMLLVLERQPWNLWLNTHSMSSLKGDDITTKHCLGS